MQSAEDIGDAGLRRALARNANPELLNELVRISRDRFGWFTGHHTRPDEYVWLAQKLQGLTHAVILDVGAGLSPVPFFAADNGNSVLTVDHYPQELDEDFAAGEKDSWGFFDYGSAHEGIKSFNQDINTLELPEDSIDVAYSISTVEHFPSGSRLALWQNLARWLKPGGRMFLSVDIYPEGAMLWNLCEGKVIEDPEQHGDIQALQAELAAARFELEETTFLRAYPAKCFAHVALLEGALRDSR